LEGAQQVVVKVIQSTLKPTEQALLARDTKTLDAEGKKVKKKLQGDVSKTWTRILNRYAYPGVEPYDGKMWQRDADGVVRAVPAAGDKRGREEGVSDCRCCMLALTCAV